jgi:hypothetical protein
VFLKEWKKSENTYYNLRYRYIHADQGKDEDALIKTREIVNGKNI